MRKFIQNITILLLVICIPLQGWAKVTKHLCTHTSINEVKSVVQPHFAGLKITTFPEELVKVERSENHDLQNHINKQCSSSGVCITTGIPSRFNTLFPFIAISSERISLAFPYFYRITPHRLERPPVSVN
jgi:hypothetical protein